MKGTIAVILAVLLLAASVTPALAMRTYMGDVVVGSGNVNFGAPCGLVIVTTGGLILLIFSLTGLCTPTTGASSLATPATFDLCKVINLVTANDIFLTTVIDANGNGKIDGTEGIKSGFLTPGNDFRFLYLDTPADGNCDRGDVGPDNDTEEYFTGQDR